MYTYIHICLFYFWVRHQNVGFRLKKINKKTKCKKVTLNGLTQPKTRKSYILPILGDFAFYRIAKIKKNIT